MQLLLSLSAGLIFGIGLIVAGMANPAKILGFLDLSGTWDPSLAPVMAGAVLVALGAFALTKHWKRSLLGLPMRLPTVQRLDRRLIVGSGVFGVGWGLSGICPGPALVLMGAGAAKGWIFGIAMNAGMALFELLASRPSPP